ncbi:MAG: geranylgeranyl reductase family protein [Verrucomicrobiales bacterium]
MISVDTAIVGAGPAGAAAAHRLAQAGHDVLLIDKATFPRDKFCGDGLTTLCLRQFQEMGFSVAGIPSFTPIEGVVLRSPSGRRHDIPLPTDAGLYAAVARREELDAALVDFAVSAGAKVRFGSKIAAVEPDRDGIVLTDDTGVAIHARQCVAADGMWSPVRKLLGLDLEKYRGEWHAFRQYFENVAPAAASEMWIWFERDVLPGYVWSFPVGDGRANVGFGILRGGDISTQQMKALWPDLLQRPHIREVIGADARPESPHRAWPIPARIDEAPLSGPRTVFVGDAATACDSLTGEGIGQALLTGRIAAASILEHAGDFGSIEKSYVSQVRAELLADHKMSELLGHLMAHPRVAELALRVVGSNEWTKRNFGRWMFEDYPRALVATPRRWSKGMFTEPGVDLGEGTRSASG